MDHSKSRARRCAIYTRKSSEEGLEQDFNSLQAQREACEAFIKSQASEGWKLVKTAYDDGGISGGTMERPALQQLLADIGEGLVDVVVVYKVDRLTRSLADFAKMVEIFDARGVSFVAVTQQFNTTTSMGRLTLNVLLSFAQFEREVTAERIRDKIAASKRKGMWMGGVPPLDMRLESVGWSSIRPKPTRCGTSMSVTWNLAASGSSAGNSTSAESYRRSGSRRRVSSQEAVASRAELCMNCWRALFISERSATSRNVIRGSTKRLCRTSFGSECSNDCA
jgi:DNA invertase Pin-like site-specific DNA recombinase